MNKIILGNIEIEFDSKKNKEFYSLQNKFSCECPDCLNYVSKLGVLKKLMNGLDEKLNIDLSKDVGQGMDELMPHDMDNYSLLVIPYYISATCLVDGEFLTKQKNGPIWMNTVKAEHQLDENLNITIINTSDSIEFENSDAVLTLWVEFKTPLLEKENKDDSFSFWNNIKNLMRKVKTKLKNE